MRSHSTYRHAGNSDPTDSSLGPPVALTGGYTVCVGEALSDESFVKLC